MAKNKNKKRSGRTSKGIITGNAKYGDRRAARKRATARASAHVRGAAVLKVGKNISQALGDAARGLEITAPGHHPARLANARVLVADANSAMPTKEERVELSKAAAAHVQEGFETTPVLEKMANGQRLDRNEMAQAEQDGAEIMDNLRETVEETASALAYKGSKWDAAAAQSYATMAALQEVITSVDALGKAAQVNGDVPEAGESWDPGTLTMFRKDGRRFSLKHLLVLGLYVRTLEMVKGHQIRFDASAKKAFIDTEAVVMQALDSTLPTRGLSKHPVRLHTSKEVWATYALTFKAAAEEKVRPYGFEPHSYEFQEYPTNECRFYRIEVFIPFNRTTGAPSWPADVMWIREEESLVQLNDAGGDVQPNILRSYVWVELNFAEGDCKATHKETIAQLIDLKPLIDAGYSIKIVCERTVYTRVRLTPTVDSYLKDLTRQGISMFGETSGQRDVASLASLFVPGPAWDTLAQSNSATAALTSITELLGTPAELATTDRKLK